MWTVWYWLSPRMRGSNTMHLAGQLLHDDVAASLGSQCAEAGSEQVDALGAGTGSVAEQEDVVAGYENVSALHVYVGVARLVVIGIYYPAAEFAAAFVYGFHDQGFAGPYAVGHLADEGIVAYGHGCVPGEIEIVQGEEGVVVLVEEGGQSIDFGGQAFDQDLGQFCGGHLHEHVEVLRYLFHDADLADEGLALAFVVEYLDEHVAYGVYLGQFLQHTAQLLVFFLGYGEVENIAVESSLGHLRGHVLDLRTWSVEQDSLQFADFGLDVYLKWFLFCHIVSCLVLHVF